MSKILHAFFFVFLFWTLNASATTVTVQFNFPLSSGFSDVSSPVIIAPDENAFTAFFLAAQDHNVTLDIQYFDFDGDGIFESAFINAVNGIGPPPDFSKYWLFSINNESALVGISAYFPSENDVLSLDYFEGQGTDAVEWLADHQEANGAFGPNLFQHAFGFMGTSLASNHGITLPPAVSENAIDFTLSQQQSDAGFGDELYTAVSVMALLSNGVELEDFAVSGNTSLDYLTNLQNSDGGFESGTSTSDVDTTSWATIAFVQAGQSLPDVNNQSPVDFLLSAQHANGSWGYDAQDTTESIEFTQEALIALSAANHPKDTQVQNALDWLSDQQDPEGCISDGFRTALGSIAFRSYNEPALADEAIDCLETMSNGDGSFGRTSNASNPMDTGLAVVAFSNQTFPLSVAPPSGDTNGNVSLNAILKFFVQIQNTSTVQAENVNVSLQGIPPAWIFDSDHGSIDHFDQILPGETKTAEIFVQVQSTGTYSVQGNVTTNSSTTPTLSNTVVIIVDESSLNASLSFIQT